MHHLSLSLTASLPHASTLYMVLPLVTIANSSIDLNDNTDMCSSGRAVNLDIGSNNALRSVAQSDVVGGGSGSLATTGVGRAGGAARGAAAS